MGASLQYSAQHSMRLGAAQHACPLRCNMKKIIISAEASHSRHMTRLLGRPQPSSPSWIRSICRKSVQQHCRGNTRSRAKDRSGIQKKAGMSCSRAITQTRASSQRNVMSQTGPAHLIDHSRAGGLRWRDAMNQSGALCNRRARAVRLRCGAVVCETSSVPDMASVEQMKQHLLQQHHMLRGRPLPAAQDPSFPPMQVGKNEYFVRTGPRVAICRRGSARKRKVETVWQYTGGDGYQVTDFTVSPKQEWLAVIIKKPAKPGGLMFVTRLTKQVTSHTADDSIHKCAAGNLTWSRQPGVLLFTALRLDSDAGVPEQLLQLTCGEREPLVLWSKAVLPDSTWSDFNGVRLVQADKTNMLLLVRNMGMNQLAVFKVEGDGRVLELLPAEAGQEYSVLCAVRDSLFFRQRNVHHPDWHLCTCQLTLPGMPPDTLIPPQHGVDITDSFVLDTLLVTLTAHYDFEGSSTSSYCNVYRLISLADSVERSETLTVQKDSAAGSQGQLSKDDEGPTGGTGSTDPNDPGAATAQQIGMEVASHMHDHHTDLAAQQPGQLDTGSSNFNRQKMETSSSGVQGSSPAAGNTTNRTTLCEPAVDALDVKVTLGELMRESGPSLEGGSIEASQVDGVDGDVSVDKGVHVMEDEDEGVEDDLQPEELERLSSELEGLRQDGTKTASSSSQQPPHSIYRILPLQRWILPLTQSTWVSNSVLLMDNEEEEYILQVDYSDPITPPSILQLNVMTGEIVRELDARLPGYEADKFQCVTEWAQHPDGMRIPITLAYKQQSGDEVPATKPSSPRPLVLTAYGAYGFINSCLDFSCEQAALMEQGAVLAIAHVRGGGELGYRWIEAGRGRNKPTAVADLVCCAKHLLDTAWTSPSQLGMWAASAGAALVGAAINEVSSGVAAVAVESPLIDVEGQLRQVHGGANVEWGDVSSPEDLEVIRSYSPICNLKQRPYPPVLLTAGAEDFKIPVEGVVSYAKKLEECHSSNRAHVHVVSGVGHAFDEQSLLEVRMLQYAWLLACMMNASGLADADAAGAD